MPPVPLIPTWVISGDSDESLVCGPAIDPVPPAAIEPTDTLPADDIPFSEPSAEWIAANEANWCDMADDDVDHAIGPRPEVHPCTWCGGRLHHSEACRELRKSWIPVLRFGRHKGKRVDEAPRDYLRWAWDNDVIRDVDVKDAVRKLLGIKEAVEELSA